MKTELDILEAIEEKIINIANEEPKEIISRNGWMYEYRNKYISAYNSEMFFLFDYNGYPHYMVNKNPFYEMKGWAYRADGKLEGVLIKNSMTALYTETMNKNIFEQLKAETEEFKKEVIKGFIIGTVTAAAEIIA